MLVVTRKVNESLLIGDDIEITILESENGKIKIGIDAPRHIKVMRKEIVESVKSENKEALSSDLSSLNHVLSVKK